MRAIPAVAISDVDGISIRMLDGARLAEFLPSAIALARTTAQLVGPHGKPADVVEVELLGLEPLIADLVQLSVPSSLGWGRISATRSSDTYINSSGVPAERPVARLGRIDGAEGELATVGAD